MAGMSRGFQRGAPDAPVARCVGQLSASPAVAQCTWPRRHALALVACLFALCAAGGARPARAAGPAPSPAATAETAPGGKGAASMAKGAPALQAAAAPADATARPSSAASPTVTSARVDQSAETLNFLGQAIDWYRGLATEGHFATQPAEMLYLDDDRQLALEIVQLAFEHARARANLIKSEAREAQLIALPAGAVGNVVGAAGAAGPVGVGQGLPGLSSLMAKEGQAEDDLRKAQAQADQLKAAIAKASGRRRVELTRQ